ncbi:2,3-diaminopropionate biosynthesis protein SbnA [Micromonospora orduensis]|uniref:N-(2-amino-2-carboxyethyl)-L-glutamate synthase n=1 Tax=Micromonospora orduensis TaxID=1420891 RepID=A0A5C4QXX5_9ACTN|nr:2,3-diaminopropionate biosynthesis protein SbnA [Micromonospora orduensis]TNH30916.1 2,3-diaminopropionate biosynthesis protein SbnA [Micromonospora orduensis]
MARSLVEGGTVREGILSTVGNTPLVQLVRLFPEFPSRLFVKLERFNPGGSIKDRTALSMLRAKVESGELVPGRSVVVESSSGNLAIGLAQVCAYYAIRFICVVDPKTTRQNLAILTAYRAEIEMVEHPDPVTGEYLPARQRRVRELCEQVPHAYRPDQYANPLNAAAQRQTMAEIVAALDGRIDYLFCSTGTCGTLVGCAGYLREHGLSTQVVAVDAVGSAIFGDEPGTRLIPGHGASVVPPLAADATPDEIMHVSDLDCVVGCRLLLHREAILAGGSSGATVAALSRRMADIPAGATAVLILPDNGDRYLDTIYSDQWVSRHFGEITHLWKDATC